MANSSYVIQLPDNDDGEGDGSGDGGGGGSAIAGVLTVVILVGVIGFIANYIRKERLKRLESEGSSSGRNFRLDTSRFSGGREKADLEREEEEKKRDKKRKAREAELEKDDVAMEEGEKKEKIENKEKIEKKEKKEKKKGGEDVSRIENWVSKDGGLESLNSAWTIGIEDIEFDSDPANPTERLVIGEGNFGKIYVGEYAGTRCAIKEMKFFDDDDDDPEGGRNNQSRFLQELQLLMSLRHPAILQTLGGNANNLIVLELCELGNMANVLRKFGKECPWVSAPKNQTGALSMRSSSGASTEKIGWAKQIVTGMIYLHSRDPFILHRDLKCANVLVATGYQMKIADFGESRRASKDAMTLTGTPYFMAPEVFAGDGHYDERCDVYSFSMMLLEMHNHGDIRPFFKTATGKSKSGGAVMSATAQGIRPDMTEVKQKSETFGGMPIELIEMMEAGWSQDPAKRPSFKEIKLMLTTVSKEAGLRAMMP